MEKFGGWLERELEDRSWTLSDLSRRSGVDTSSISRILSNTRKPGPDVVLAIARALGESPEKCFRLAGLLPDLPIPEDEKLEREVVEVLRHLPPDDRLDVLEYARWRYRRRQETTQ